MPRLLVNEEGFRIVHDIAGNEDVFVLEQREGDDAMGQPHWRRVETKSTRMLSLLYKYIIKEKDQMNIDSAFPSTYLKASDLGDAQPVVTIDRVEVEPVGRDKEMKPIVYFKGKDKGLVLNKTNGRKISELTGSKDTDDWKGCQVRIYATETEFGGETVECIRVKAPKAVKEPKPAVKPEPEMATELDDSDIPF